jgi:hypothetical protein
MQDLLTTGSETSSGIVLWVMSEMVKNPRVMEEAQAEVRKEFYRKGYVTYAGLVYLVCQDILYMVSLVCVLYFSLFLYTWE